MGWIVKALASLILSILDDWMTWGARLITDLKLDIGMDGSISTTIAYVDPRTAGQNSLLAQTFPGATDYCFYFMVIAMMIVFLVVIFKLWQGLISPFTESEHPVTVIGRSGLAAFGVYSSYSLFVCLERIFNSVFTSFKSVYDTQTKDAFTFMSKKTTGKNMVSKEWSNATKKELATQTGKGATTGDHHFKFFSSDKLINSKSKDNLTGSGTGFSVMIIECVIGFALIFSFIKLVLEIYERYLVVGLLFYTCPLAFATLASKGTSKIFGSWLQMVITQFIMMCLNLFFVGTFISAFNTVTTVKEGSDYLFDSDVKFVTTMLLLLGWTIVGQKADEYMKGMGLSVAATGQGLGAAVVGGVGTTLGGIRLAKTAYKDAKALGKLGGKIGGAIGGAVLGGAIGKKAEESRLSKGEKAMDALSKSETGAMSAGEFEQNLADRGGISNPNVNTAAVDYEKSAAMSGMGASVLADKDGKILDMSVAPGSAAHKALQAKNIRTRQDPESGMIKPVSDSDMKGLYSNVTGMASEGKLPAQGGVAGRDPVRYDRSQKVMGHPNNKVYLHKFGTEHERIVDVSTMYNITGSENMPEINSQQDMINFIQGGISETGE